MRRIRDFLVATYFSVDPRSLGLFRIAFGCVLLFNLYVRWRVIDLWYTNDGLMPNYVMLANPPTERMFSLFFTASTHAEAMVGMLVCALAFASFTLG
jgi:hypothetical protein